MWRWRWRCSPGRKESHTACWRGTSEPTILILAAVLLPLGEERIFEQEWSDDFA
jgi:hypothetical protein